MADLLRLCARVPVIPVLIVDDVAAAVPLARALVAGGLDVLEVTLRTPVALAAIRAMATEVPDAVVGVGTLRTAADVAAARAAGARFGVSPGLSDAVLDASAAEGLPILPGVATPSEAMRAAERGLRFLKFFPATAAGGLPMLRAWASPLADLVFCPTGGIDAGTAPAWLALPNVVCVGGSWVAPADAVAAGDWARIEALARATATLRPGP